jgi:hypothetical protein
MSQGLLPGLRVRCLITSKGRREICDQPNPGRSGPMAVLPWVQWQRQRPPRMPKLDAFDCWFRSAVVEQAVGCANRNDATRRLDRNSAAWRFANPSRRRCGGYLRLLLISYPGRDAVTQIFVDMAPIVEGPRENGF